MSVRRGIHGSARRWLLALATLLLLFLAYLWAGYVLAPRLIRSEALRWARSRPGLTLSLGAIKVDPLHITVTARDIRLGVRGQTLAVLPRVFVGLDPLSLITGTYHFTALDFDAPRLDVVLGADGALNLAALAAPATSRPGAAMPSIRIDDLRIDQGRLSVTDLERSPVARETLAPLMLRLVHFRSWTRAGGRFALQANTGNGGRIDWRGRLSMTPVASAGTLSIARVKLAALARFVPHPPMRLRAGRLSARVRYTLTRGSHGLNIGASDLSATATALSLGGGTLLNGIVHVAGISATGGSLHLGAGGAADASLAQLRFTRVRLRGNGSARGQIVTLRRLSLAQTRLDLSRHRVSVGALALRGLRLPVRRAKDGRLALLRLLPAAKPTPVRGAAHSTARSRWHVRLARFAVHDAVVPVRDLTVTPAAHFKLRLYSLTARALGTDLERTVPFTLHAGIAPRAYLALSGRITPEYDSAALWLSLAHLPLRPFVAYLPLARTAEVHSGTLGARGFAQIEKGRLVRLNGLADVRKLQLLERANGVALFGWRELSLRKIAYRPAHLVIGLARLTAPTGQFVILPNRTLNLAALAPPHTRRGTAPAGNTTRQARAPTARPVPSALLKRLDIVDGSITFADESVEPHFHAPVDDLHGSIANVSTSKRAVAHIALAGQVIDRHSPVAVSGSFNPYGLGNDTDIRAAFDNIQLPIFDPYSDRYAGYAIAKGILSAHFRYQIDDRRLNADHRIVVEQLQWGGPSASTRRVGWPIRLATALLKDRNGVIRINLPVTGSLNDPDFHIASIVWTMLVHLLEKAALAPFDLIGRLFSGAAQAQYIAFRPGSAALSHAAAANLTALAHALSARPALSVDIPAGPAGPDDAIALENARIDALALARRHGAPPGGFNSLSVREQLRALEALYHARLAKRPAYPQHLPARSRPPVEAATGREKTPVTLADKRRIRERSEIRWLRAQLRPTVPTAPGALTALGLARAQNVQEALLAYKGLSPKRVFITTKKSGQPWHHRIRLTLRLQ